jgi:hypothetical protein
MPPIVLLDKRRSVGETRTETEMAQTFRNPSVEWVPLQSLLQSVITYLSPIQIRRINQLLHPLLGIALATCATTGSEFSGLDGQSESSPKRAG